jgi:hypothetical protein
MREPILTAQGRWALLGLALAIPVVLAFYWTLILIPTIVKVAGILLLCWVAFATIVFVFRWLKDAR